MRWDEDIKGRLNRLRHKRLELKVGGGLWRSLAGLAALLLAGGLLEMVFRFDPSVRIPLAVCLAICASGLIGIWIVYPLLRHLFKPTPAEELALAWGYSIPHMNDRLLNALQVYENRERDQTSPELAEVALEVVAQEVKDTSFEGALDRRPVRTARLQTLWVAGAWIVAGLISQGSMGAALGRLAQPGTDFHPAPPFWLTLENVPELVIRTEPFDVTVAGYGDLPPGVTVHVHEAKSDPQEYYTAFDSSGQATYTLPNPQSDMDIYASWEDVHSDTARITVKSRPFIKDLQVRWYPPAYSQLPSGSSAQKRGDVAALKGSRVRVSVQADRGLKAADLLIYSDDDPEKPIQQSMDIQSDQASQEFTLLRSGHYNIILEDFDGIQNAAPVDYNLWPIQDEWPTVSIIYPPPEAELNESLLIPIKAGARDDFAVSRIRLGYQWLRSGQEDTSQAAEFIWEKIPYEDLGDGTVLVDQLWDLTGLNLLPGDVILYKLEAWDNDRISGPKRAETAVQRLRFPTLEEIFTRVEESFEGQVDDISEALDRSVFLKEELETLREELKRNPELSWEEKKKVEEMLARQEDMARKVDEMAERVEEMVRKMEENRLLSPETMEKYMELQQMLSEVMTPELLQAMQKLQEALQQQNPEQLRQAVEEFSLNQEKFLAKMEKALNILKQLKMEMKLDELARRAEELLEKQKQVNAALDDSSKQGPQPKDAQAEKQLQQEMEAFEREFAAAQELLAESPHNPEETLSEAAQLLEENQFPQAMSQMSQDLQQGDLPPAQQKGARIQSGLAQLSDMMKRAKEQFISSGKSALAEALKKISHDLLSLSYQQEELLDVSGTLDKASPRFRSLAQQQQTLKKHLEKTASDLFELSQQSYFITPQIGAAISQAFNGMDQALAGYTARAPRSVSRQQQSAMGGLNQAIMGIGQSMDQLSSSSSSTGFSEMMEQLSKMAGQQGEINQGTMSLLPMGGNPGQLSPQQQAAMARLAAEQEALRQDLRSWNQANQEVSKMLGRLEELGKEMQEVAQDLKNRQVDQRTLQRQERILRRLLDAQKSIREREYRRERISRTAEGSYLKASPKGVDLGLTPDEARENLLRALKEGYTRDYQQLIRDYFEALAREK